MRFIDPAFDPQGRMVLAGLYPFVRDVGSYDYKSASALLKTECLLQRECTIPGSMALENEIVRNMIKEHSELVRSGVFVLDLRNTAKSFNDLTIDKFGSKAPDEIKEMADYLDDICPSVIHFDPSANSDVYKDLMRSFLIRLSERQSSGHAINLVMKLVDAIDRHAGFLSFSDTASLKSNIEAIDDQVLAAAKYYYCVCGGDFVQGSVQVPQSLWDKVHLTKGVVQIKTSESVGQSDLSRAHHAVLEHFAVQLDALYRLTNEDILELRSEGATRRTIDQLHKIIEEARLSFDAEGSISELSLEELNEYQRELTTSIQKQCEKQARRASPLGLAGMGADEIVAAGAGVLESGIPLAGIARKGLMHTGKVLSRKFPKAKHADITLTPIHTYVTRLQTRISVRPV